MNSVQEFNMEEEIITQMDKVFEQFITLRCMYEKGLILVKLLQIENPTSSELEELKATEKFIIEKQEKLNIDILRALDCIYNQ